MRVTSVSLGKAKKLFDHKRIGKFNPYQAANQIPKTFFCEINSQQSTGAPPLGPILGARGVPLNKFNDDFNQQTLNIK